MRVLVTPAGVVDRPVTYPRPSIVIDRRILSSITAGMFRLGKNNKG